MKTFVSKRKSNQHLFCLSQLLAHHAMEVIKSNLTTTKQCCVHNPEPSKYIKSLLLVSYTPRYNIQMLLCEYVNLFCSLIREIYFRHTISEHNFLICNPTVKSLLSNPRFGFVLRTFLNRQI